MAINLTTNWQVVDSATWNFSNVTIVNVYLEAKYSTQDLVNNRTTVQTRLRTELQAGYGSGFGYNFTCSFAPTVSGSNEWYLATEVITTGEATIQHLPDGTQIYLFSGSASISGLGVSSNLSGYAIFPPIPRASVLSSASMAIATNGNSITITPTMTKNVPTYYDSLVVKNGTTTLFTLDGVTNNTAVSLSSAQINSIYSAIDVATTKTFTCYLHTKTSSSGSDVGNSASVNLVANLPSYSITLSPSVSDTITAYDPYKPNANTYIANISKPQFTLSTTSSTNSFYGRSVSYTLNGTSITSPYTMNNYTGQNISITATDGRKTDTKTPTMTHVPYFSPTLNTSVVRTTPTGSTIDISVSGTLYKGTGLTNLLTPTLKFKYTQSGGLEQEVTIPLTLTDNNNVTSFTGTYQLTGMNYQKSVAWSAKITDRIGISRNNGNTLPQGLPVFHCYRESDKNYFNIYGELLIKGVNPFEYTLNKEEVIGTYNNKPLYRYWFTYDKTLNTGASSFNYNVSNFNIDLCFVKYTILKRYNTPYQMQVENNYYLGENDRVTIFFRQNKIEFRVGCDSDSVPYRFIMKLYYTKTTD